MNLLPLEDRIILKPIEEEQKGLIHIPEGAKERPVFGEVIAVGPGKPEGMDIQQMKIRIRDTVLFGKYSGTEVEIDGEIHYVMRQSDVMAVKV